MLPVLRVVIHQHFNRKVVLRVMLRVVLRVLRVIFVES